MRVAARRARARGRPRDDGGSQILEFAAYFPLFLLVAALALEVFVSFVAVEQAENAARAGARAAGAAGGGPAAAVSTAQQALPPWLDGAVVTAGTREDAGHYTEVRIDLPIVFRIADFDLTVVRRADMP
ncbi:TadE/TadG family type IV pilus assembly protein [Marinactinospora rubrisoli]|uniref:TadE/TadG family type IV pilus assembly protein n=1 Tax=Marinactinospora rubrisoli TaxID=2715399 RepID=A0ABW2KK76_9ACTN